MSIHVKNHELFQTDYFVTDKDLKSKRLLIAKKLNITLEEPRQEKRIEALFKLLKTFLYKSDTKAYLFQKVIESSEKLNSIYLHQIKEMEEIEIENQSADIKEKKLGFLHYKNIEKINSLEEKILYYKELMFAYENKNGDLKNLPESHFEELKKIDDKCFSYWVKTLDINSELRNTIIGYHNRLALFKTANAYINYHLFVEKKTQAVFHDIKKLKKDGIVEYYELLNQFSLPHEKLLNFQLFLQKKIESKLHSAMELKLSLGNQLDFDCSQISSNVELVKQQHDIQQDEIIAVINFYKQSLLQKQVIFTDEANAMVNYLKERYVEKINEIFSRVSDFKKIFKQERSDLLEDEDKNILVFLAQQEMSDSLIQIKDRYAKQFVPLLDSFDKMFASMENKMAFDFFELEKQSIELKTLKNLNVQYLLDKFNNEKSKFEEIFSRKELLINDASMLTVLEANKVVDKLKKHCESICCDILGFNQRFWTKINAEFNAEARRHLLKLHYEYAPWVHVWNSGDRPWFHDYLIMNLNQEYLNAVGQSLEGFSPEAKMFVESSKALLQLNEYLREVYKNRDLVEYEHLLKLNTIPEVDLLKLQDICEEKLDELKNTNLIYLKKYNNFYNSFEKKIG